MSTTAERLFYPVQRAVTTNPEFVADTKVIADRIAAEFVAENLVLASREDIRLAVEVAYRGTYGDMETPLNDATRTEIDSLSSSVFTELERSA